MRKWLGWIVMASAVIAASLAHAQEPKTLRVVMHSDIKVLDPVWSGAYIVRNHGYLIYDTLFALDENFQGHWVHEHLGLILREAGPVMRATGAGAGAPTGRRWAAPAG